MEPTTTNVAQIASIQDCRVILFVPMEDDLVHTAANNYRCNDETCPCQGELQEGYYQKSPNHLPEPLQSMWVED